MPTKRDPITTPAPKYGPTGLYGQCEYGDCDNAARVTCDECRGHYCRSHGAHETHADS